jgi:hypothetical protein
MLRAALNDAHATIGELRIKNEELAGGHQQLEKVGRGFQAARLGYLSPDLRDRLRLRTVTKAPV